MHASSAKSTVSTARSVLAALWFLALAGIGDAAAQTSVPEAPAITVERGGSGELVVAWDRPGNGGSAITGYQARASLDGGGNWSSPIDLPFEDPSAPARFEATFPDLVNGTTYTLQIRAVNGVGNGGWSAAAAGTPATLPGAPTGVALSLGDNGRDIEVRWTAPDSDGGAAVTYTVETSRGGTVVDTQSGISGTAATVSSGVVRGAEHSVRIQAVNDVGAGGWSASATITPTPADLPGKPKGVAVWLGTNPLEIEVVWRAPDSDGGAPVTSYTVETSRGGTVVDTRSGIAGTAATVDSGLVAGERHSVRVQAVNDVGAGAWSAPATIVPVESPLLPMSIAVEPGDRRLTVRWSAPDMPVASYIVEYREAGSRYWAPSRSIGRATFEYEISGLTNGEDYEVRVGGVHDTGYAAWSGVVEAAPAGPPAAPKVQLSGGTGTVEVEWSAPFDGGSPIIGYELQYKQDNSAWRQPSRFFDAATTSHTIDRLLNGRYYTVRVRAINRAGRGTWNAANTILLTAGAPEAPEIHVLPYTDRIDVSWGVPYDGGSPITSYDAWLCARWNDGSRPLCQIGQDLELYNVRGRARGRVTFAYYVPGAHYYTAQVRANNDAGKGAWTQQRVEHGAPFPPPSVRLVAHDGRLWVGWNKPVSDNGAPVTAYRIHLDGNPEARAEIAVSNPDHPIYSTMIDGLTNGRTYVVQVAAVNARGPGGWSAPERGVPVAAPGAPPEVWLEPAAAAATLRVKWSMPDSRGSIVSSYLLRYRVQRPNGVFGAWNPNPVVVGPRATGHTLKNLSPGVYQVQVAARSSRWGVGDWSDTLPTGEVFGLPYEPTNIVVRDGDSPGVLDVSWSAPRYDGGSAVTQYQLRYRDVQAGSWSPVVETGSTGTSYRLAGLVDDASYEVQVRAQNAFGNGAWGRWGGLPTAPRDLALKAGESGKLVATWSPPADFDQSRLTRYRVRWKTGNFVKTVWTRGPVTEYTITGLENGVVYAVSVSAQAGSVRGHFSAAVEAIPAAPPGAPAVTLTPGGATTMEVAWTAPDDDGGSPVTGYDLRWRQRSTTDWSDANGLAADADRYTLTGLQSATAWEVEVRAFNAAAAGAYSATATASTREASSDATLSALSAADANGALRLEPSPFSADTYRYSTAVDGDTGSVTVTAAVNERNATLAGSLAAADGRTWAVNMASGAAATVRGLTTGVNVLTVEVTAEDGTPAAYELRVKRVAGPTATIVPSGDFETTGGPSSPVHGVRAGADLTLSATAADPDGGAVTFAWTASDHPNDVTSSVFAGATNAATATFRTSTPGDYTVTLTVTDDEGDTARDWIRVRVSEGAPNQAPAVDIDPGEPESADGTGGAPPRLARSGGTACRTAFCVEVNTDLTLSAAANDDDGRIASYRWSVLTDGGRNNVTGDVLSGSDTATVTFNASAPGEYRVVVHVLDDDNASATATMTVTAVEPSSDATLSALSATDEYRSPLRLTPSPFSAGTLAYSTVVDKKTAAANVTATANDFGATLAGSLLRAGGDTPAPVAMTGGKAAALTDLAPGDNVLTVTVTAQDGTTQDYTLTVKRMGPPVARIDPGGSPRVAAGTNLTLDASSSTDPDGGAIVDYAWYATDSGGRNATDAVFGGGVSGPTVTFNAAVAGEYTVWLTVLDDEGDTAEVLLTISVAASLSVADASATEGAGAKLAFAVALSGAADVPVTVAWATSDGTATAGEDYVAASGTLSFAAGETGKIVEVSVLDDAHDEETETLTLTLSNASGAEIADGEAVGRIHNADPMPAAWLARFGRTVADQALDGISARLEAPRAAGFEGSLGGQTLALGAEAGAPAFDTEGDAPAKSVWGGDAGAVGTIGFESAEGAARSRTMSVDDLLPGSAFTLTGGVDSAGGTLAFWGRGAQTRFDGREDTLDLDGTVTAGMLGADYARGGWTLGLALLRSEGDGGYADRGPGSAAGTMAGEIESSLTAAVPYAAWRASERLDVWGAAGFGSGETTLAPEGGAAIETDVDWNMAAAGVRSELLAPQGRGPGLALTSDAMWARTSSDAAAGLAASESDTSRLRVGLEASWPVALDGGGRIEPRLEIGARHDGGDAETGAGVDVGGGIAWSDPGSGLSLELEGRTLLAHAADGREETGYAASLAFDPAPSTRRGLSLGLRQDWGARAAGGLDALFAADPLSGSAAAGHGGAGASQGRWTAEAAYGFAALGGRFASGPHAEVGLASGSRDYSLGWRVTPEGPAAPDLSLGLALTRRESAAGGAEGRIGFELKARW